MHCTGLSFSTPKFSPQLSVATNNAIRQHDGGICCIFSTCSSSAIPIFSPFPHFLVSVSYFFVPPFRATRHWYQLVITAIGSRGQFPILFGMVRVRNKKIKVKPSTAVTNNTIYNVPLFLAICAFYR